MRKSTTILSLCLLLLVSLSCDKDEDRDAIPYIYVNFDIYPNSLPSDFIPIGGYSYRTGGYKGIIIYRPQEDEFMAYERACPHDPLAEGARVYVESNSIIAVDSVCGSRFLLTDGSPLKEGPATIGLKQYRTHWDGYQLQVTN